MAILKVVTDAEVGVYLDYGNIEAGKLNPVLPAVNPVAVGSVPATTGNATNRNEFVVDPNGDNWFIDYAGDGVRLTAASPTPVFQAMKTVDQVSGTAWATLANWDAPDETASAYSFDATTGVLTFNVVGLFEVNAWAIYDSTGNNRVEVALKLVDSSGNVNNAADRQYAIRNNGFDNGSAQINGYYYRVSSVGETLFIQEQRVGSGATVIAARFGVKKVQ